MKVVKLESKASDLKFKLVGNRLVSKTTRRSVMSAHEIADGTSTRFPEEIDPTDEVAPSWRVGEEESMYKYSLMEDTRVSKFTNHQILLVEKNILVLALLIIFLGMIKI